MENKLILKWVESKSTKYLEELFMIIHKVLVNRRTKVVIKVREY